MTIEPTARDLRSRAFGVLAKGRLKLFGGVSVNWDAVVTRQEENRLLSS